MEEKTVFTEQEYAIRLLQMLQDFSEDLIKIDTVIIIVKMLSKHPIDHAVIFATGDPYKVGALEFEDRYMARRFIDQMSDKVVYATIIDGAFNVFQDPYRSRVMQEWVFVELDSQAMRLLPRVGQLHLHTGDPGLVRLARIGLTRRQDLHGS